MARAHEHLASARYAEAAGAFRAVLRIDPNELSAHFGLADALVARGQRTEAVDGLVEAAESCTARDDHGAALTLYGKALSVDPMRLELHLDVAMAEAALGRMEAAQSRLEHLAEVYMQAGRTDEAAEVYRCLAGWEDDGEAAVDEPAASSPAAPARRTEVPTSGPAQPPPRGAVPLSMMPTSETVVIPTILVTPDGQLYQVPIEQQAQAWAPASGDTVPPVPVELLEVVHSAPVDLAAGQEEVERTVVAYPPPPPSLPEAYESAAHTVDRRKLEEAVVAAMDNLAQLEEEDMTLVMQRLPPQPKVLVQRTRTRTGETRLPDFVTRSRAVRPRPEPEPAFEAPAELELDGDLDPHAALEVDDDLHAEDEGGAEPETVEEPAPEGKLRIKPAPRPVGKAAAAASKASAPVGKPAASGARPSSPVAGKAAPVGKAAAAGGVAAMSKAVAASKPATSKAVAASKPAAASKAAAASKPATSKAVAASKPATSTPVMASPPTTTRPSMAGGKPMASSGTLGAASKPAAAGRPAASSGTLGAASRPGSAGPVSPSASKPLGSAAGVAGKGPLAGAGRAAGPGAQPGPAAGEGRPAAADAGAPKATRPDNPLAERLRRRAGLHKPDAAPGRPTQIRPTEPISVRNAPRPSGPGKK